MKQPDVVNIMQTLQLGDLGPISDSVLNSQLFILVDLAARTSNK